MRPRGASATVLRRRQRDSEPGAAHNAASEVRYWGEPQSLWQTQAALVLEELQRSAPPSTPTPS